MTDLGRIKGLALDRCRDDEIVVVDGESVACVRYVDLEADVRRELTALGVDAVAFPHRYLLEMAPGGKVPAHVRQYEVRAGRGARVTRRRR